MKEKRSQFCKKNCKQSTKDTDQYCYNKGSEIFCIFRTLKSDLIQYWRKCCCLWIFTMIINMIHYELMMLYILVINLIMKAAVTELKAENQ